MRRMATKSGKPVRNFPLVGVRPESRKEIDRISEEWRMNIQGTVAALIELWNNSSDEQKVNAIRRPATDKRALQTA